MKSSKIYIFLFYILFYTCLNLDNALAEAALPLKKEENIYFKDCRDIEIQKDKRTQKALYYQSTKPLKPLIVSLHTWGGTYWQDDQLAIIAKQLNWNYIHPNYGGAQSLWNDGNSCCFKPAIQDIDDAVEFALNQNSVDTSRIIIIGKSGGGSGVLGSYLQSKYSSSYFFAWSPITDYISWYEEVQKSRELSERYLKHILNGTNSSNGSLNIQQAKLKSPYYYDFSKLNNLSNKKLIIYAGIRDGLDGWSTSLSQPILFYNKLARYITPNDTSNRVANSEYLHLINNRTAIDNKISGYVGDKKLIYKISKNNISLVIHEGGHEILYDQVLHDFSEIAKIKK